MGGVKGHNMNDTTLPGSPALCLPAGRQGGELHITEPASPLPYGEKEEMGEWGDEGTAPFINVGKPEGWPETPKRP